MCGLRSLEHMKPRAPTNRKNEGKEKHTDVAAGLSRTT
jgi:hypothetical protein